MSFTKFYRKKAAILALLMLCFLLSFVNSLFKRISDELLDALSLDQQKKSHFNPRAITYALLTYIQTRTPIYTREEAMHAASILENYNGINFHWDDWVDLSPGDSYLERARKAQPDGFCSPGLTKFSQVNPYFMESYKTKVNRGMANLYCEKDIPKRILVSTDAGFFEIPVTGKKRIGHDPRSSGISKQELIDMVTKTPQLDPSNNKNAHIKFIEYLPLQKAIHISPQDFIFDLDKEIMILKEQLAMNKILPQDKEHLKFLETSNLIVDLADRFFKYPWIYSDIVAGRSHHTSFPFFKRFISSKERLSVIQHMVRTWFKFSEASGVNSWVNYGSLLGWAYNGVNLPWDTDVDVQIPIAQLDKLSKRFNSTIITENPKDGNAKYYFEVSPTYTRQGNGRNFIDARFIEINTGLYIDISALAHTNDQPPKSLLSSLSEEEKLRAMPVHCKHWNWHLLDEILPIRPTLFEGSPVYIPHNILSILLRNYGQDSFTSKHQFNGYHYNQALQLWIPEKENARECVLNPKASGINALSNTCRSSWIKDEYRINHDAAECHKKHDYNVDYSVIDDIAEYPNLPLTRKDSYDYFQDIIDGNSSDLGWFDGQL